MKTKCIANSTLVSLFAKRFPGRTLVIPRTWIRKEVVFYLQRKTTEENGTESLNWWWSNSEKADTQFSEPRVPLSRGTLKSKRGGKLSRHFCADGDTIETVFAKSFLSISSVSTEQSQICMESTVAVEQEQEDLLWQDNPTHFSRQQTYWYDTQSFDWNSPHKKIYCKSTRNEWKGSHNQIVWLRFVLVQDVWQQLTSDSTSWQNILTSSYNFAELVTSRECTLPRDDKSTDPKGWIQGNTKVGPRIGSHNQLPTR